MITEIFSWCKNKSFITATKSVMVWKNIFPMDLFSFFHISISLMISFHVSSSTRYCKHVWCYQCVLQDPSSLNSIQSPNNTWKPGLYIPCIYIFLDSACIFIGPAKGCIRRTWYCIVFILSDKIGIGHINTICITVHTNSYDLPYLS
jgi:hypothetical protein